MNAERFAHRILHHLRLTTGKVRRGVKSVDHILYGTGNHDHPGERIVLKGIWNAEDRVRPQNMIE